MTDTANLELRLAALERKYEAHDPRSLETTFDLDDALDDGDVEVCVLEVRT